MKKQNIILAIALSWLCGLSCCHLFTANKVKTTDTASPSVKEIESSYHKTVAPIILQNDELKTVLHKTTTVLATVQQSNKQLQQALQQQISKQQQYKEEKDTIHLLSGCDTLEKKTTEYIIAVNRQDSLQQLVTDNLTTQLNNKDTIIALQDMRYTSMQSQYSSEIKSYQKVIKQQKRTSTLKTIGLVVLTAFSVNRLR